MAAVTAMALGIAGLGAVASPAAAAADEVLILDSTVSGGASSTLAQKFQLAGKTPVVVNAATWGAMTAADFADYDAIVLGDPDCGFVDTTPIAAAEANAATWGSVVDGNVVVLGTDETFHETQGGDALMEKAAAFSVAAAGKTGAYISLSCYYHSLVGSVAPPVLSGLGSFAVEDSDGGYNDVHIVATHPALTGLTDTDLSNWGNSVHETFTAWPSSFEVLAIARDLGSTYTAPDGTVGTPYILARGVEVISDIDLTPASATNPVGTSHELTATVTTDDPAPGTPVEGTLVTFTVIDGPHAGETGTDTTDSAGVATWSYTGTLTGTDTIVATFVDGSAATQTSNKATKTWEEAAGPHDTSTTYTGDGSVQYSDAAGLSGNLQDFTAGVPLAGKTLDFELGTQNASAGPTDASGDASTSLVVTQMPGSVSSVKTSFAGDADYNPSADKDPFEVLKEDCTLNYSGDTLVAPATATNLTATLGELDSSLGDLSGKTVKFTVTGVGGSPASYTAVTDSTGKATTSQNLLPNVYDVAISFAGDDYYNGCTAAAGTIITVQDANAKVTGGGWINPKTGRTNFGFNAIPVAGGWKGQLQIRSSNGKNLFHSPSVVGLTATANTAKWTGTGKWNGATGYNYVLAVVDNGSSGSKKLDTISITITKIGASTPVYTSSGYVALKGGNITVHK